MGAATMWTAEVRTFPRKGMYTQTTFSYPPGVHNATNLTYTTLCGGLGRIPSISGALYCKITMLIRMLILGETTPS